MQSYPYPNRASDLLAEAERARQVRQAGANRVKLSLLSNLRRLFAPLKPAT